MSIFESVFKISNQIYENSKHVTIDYDYINNEGKNLILNSSKPISKVVNDPIEIRKHILKELVLDSINYCYWYGSSNYRPNNSSATKLLNIVDVAFTDYCRGDKCSDSFSDCIDKVKLDLIEHRFTMLNERINHLDELVIDGDDFADLILLHIEGKATFDYVVEILLQHFPGYASDLFLKRAALLFINLYRTTGLFEQQLKQLPVPADYQVPKMLRHFKFIKYGYELEASIEHEIIIPKCSRMEVEIRAATVLACQKLSEVTGWNVSEVDTWFWTKRNESMEPFHLTITTDY